MDEATVLYDGHCGLCTRIHDRFAPRTRAGLLRWVRIESPEGQAILAPRGLVEEAQRSMVLVTGGQVRLRTDAAVQVLRRLTFPHSLLAPLLWLVPKPLREWQYRRIAARRRDVCALPLKG